MQKQNTIVIVGGGFAGVTAITELAKHIKYGFLPKETKVILIDRKDYHLYHPNLYEVATAEEEFVSVAALKKSIALPFHEIIADLPVKNIQFIQGDLTAVDQVGKSISIIPIDKTKISLTTNEADQVAPAAAQKIPFDYLVLALGSVSDDFGIPGVSEFGLTLGSLTDALKIRNAVEFLVQSHQMDVVKKPLRIVLGGGGFTGIELASEMLNLIEILIWKYNYPGEKIELMMIEGAPMLMPGMPDYISSTIYHRLKSFGIHILLGSVITKVEKTGNGGTVSLNNGEVYDWDLFIWTGGIKASKVPFAAGTGDKDSQIAFDRKGRAMTSPDLTIKGFPNIFVVGDDACVMDTDNHPMPTTATQAIQHAEYAAKAIVDRIADKEPKPHACQPMPFIVPVRGKWAIMHMPSGFTMQGFIPWLGKSYAAARYFNRFMPFWDAIKLVLFEDKVYTRND